MASAPSHHDQPGTLITPIPERPVVCVQGLGFVGAAMAVAVASATGEDGQPLYSVVGVDLPTPTGEARIEKINSGTFPFATADAKLVKSAQAAFERGNLSATNSSDVYANADIIVVDVHLDITSGKVPEADFGPFVQAIETLGEKIRPGTLIVVETTVPPGACEHVIAPALSREMEKRGLQKDSYLLAHSYERVMPGKDYLDSIVNFWRVYSGYTTEAADRCEQFLRSIINVDRYPLSRMRNTTASEMAKVLENSYRATNIAFIEEWARFAERVGVDLFEVIDAIRLRPTHNNMRQPGFGVGGYCLTKDPLFPGVAARTLFDMRDLEFPFTEMAVSVNAAMPLVTVEHLAHHFDGELRGRRVLLLGVAYRQDVADTRHSPSETFADELLVRGADLVAHDPIVAEWPEVDVELLSAGIPDLSGFDAVVFAVPHTGYREFDPATQNGYQGLLVVDANCVLDEGQRRRFDDRGATVISIGRGAES